MQLHLKLLTLPGGSAPLLVGEARGRLVSHLFHSNLLEVFCIFIMLLLHFGLLVCMPAGGLHAACVHVPPNVFCSTPALQPRAATTRHYDQAFSSSLPVGCRGATLSQLQSPTPALAPTLMYQHTADQCSDATTHWVQWHNHFCALLVSTTNCRYAHLIV